MFKARKITKKFGKFAVLYGVNFNINPQDVQVLIGPNGAGKTTLLNIFSTIISPTSGTIEFEGESIFEDIIEYRGQIGFLGHNPFLYEELSPVQNLRFFAKLYNIPKPTAEQRIDEYLRKLGLHLHKYRPVGNFSRGMKQRLGIIRALIHEPRILFLDEPFTGLDQRSTAIFFKILHQFVANNGAVILVSHNLHQAYKLGTKFNILSNGRIQERFAKTEISEPEFVNRYNELITKGITTDVGSNSDANIATKAAAN